MRQTGTEVGCVQLSFGGRAKCLIPEQPQHCTTAKFFCLVKEDYTRKPLRVRLCTTWLDRNVPKKQTTIAVCSAPCHVIRSELAEETDDYCCLFGFVPRDSIGTCRRNRRLLLFVRLRATWLDRNLPKKQTTIAVCSAPYHVTRSELAEETDDYCRSTKHTTRLHSNSYGLPRNHGFRAKARSITYADCVSIALFIKHATRMRRIILSSVACLAVP